MPVDLSVTPLEAFPVAPGSKGSINDPEAPGYDPDAPYRDSGGNPILLEADIAVTVAEFNDEAPILLLPLPFVAGEDVGEALEVEGLEGYWAWGLPNGQFLVLDDDTPSREAMMSEESTYVLLPEEDDDDGGDDNGGDD